jgi:hypothetical protein
MASIGLLVVIVWTLVSLYFLSSTEWLSVFTSPSNEARSITSSGTLSEEQVEETLFLLKVPVHTKSTVSFSSDVSPLHFHVVFTVDTVTTLNVRCIESILHFHPNAIVNIYTNAVASTHVQEDPRIRSLSAIGNLRFLPYSAESVIEQALAVPDSAVDSELASQWRSRLEEHRRGPYWFSNESNLLRLCLLYTVGGIYLDTDVILTQPLAVPVKNGTTEGLAVDNAMARDGGTFHCAVMKFLRPGNPFLGACINDFFKNYDGAVWGNNGPRVFHRTKQSHPHHLCDDVEDPSRQPILLNSDKTCWLNPLPSHSFQPISWKAWPRVCWDDKKSPVGAKAAKILKRSYAVHLNNQITSKAFTEESYLPNTVCDMVLSQYCVLCE